MVIEAKYELEVDYSIVAPEMIPTGVFKFIHPSAMQFFSLPSESGKKRKKVLLGLVEGGASEEFLLGLEETGADFHSLITFAITHHKVIVAGPNVTAPGVHIPEAVLWTIHCHSYPCAVNVGGGFCSLYASNKLDIQGKWRFLMEDRS